MLGRYSLFFGSFISMPKLRISPGANRPRSNSKNSLSAVAKLSRERININRPGDPGLAGGVSIRTERATSCPAIRGVRRTCRW